jgi:hypothetical protein
MNVRLDYARIVSDGPESIHSSSAKIIMIPQANFLRVYCHVLMAWFAVVFFSTWPTTPACAALVLFNDGSEPAMGGIVREDNVQIVLRAYRPDGKTLEQVIARSKIAEIQETVSSTRLESLQPEKPRDYLEYAEILSAKKRDWEARETALRLFSIVLTNHREKLGARALKGMAALAISPAESYRYRLALALLDPTCKLTPRDAEQSQLEKSTRDTTHLAVQGLQSIRQGKGSEGKTLLAQPPIVALLRDYEAIITRNELDIACQEKQLTARQLRQILILEFTLENRLELTGESAANLTWSAEMITGGNAPVLLIDWDHLTPYDGHENIFRNGKWVKE